MSDDLSKVTRGSGNVLVGVAGDPDQVSTLARHIADLTRRIEALEDRSAGWRPSPAKDETP